MLAMALAVGLTLGPRPIQIVKPSEEATYAAWLEGEMRKTAAAYAGKDCSSAVVQSITGAPLQDIVVRQHPEIFFWLEATRVMGCGSANVQQLGVIRNGEAWRAIPMAPGLSTASPSLQRDIGRSLITVAAALAHKADVACTADVFAKSFRVTDTRQFAPHTTGKPWSELWSLHACSGDYNVKVDFTPASDGGTDFIVNEQP